MSLKKKLLYRSTLTFLITLVFICTGSYFLYRYGTEEAYEKKLLGTAKLAGEFYLEKDELNEITHKRIGKKFNKISDVNVKLYKIDTTTTIDSDEPDHTLSAEDIISKTVRDSTYTFKKGNRVFVSLFYPDNEGNFVIIVSGIDYEGIERMKLLAQMFILFGFIGIVLHIVLTNMLAKKTFLPFKDLITQVNSIKGDEWHIRLKYLDNSDELNQFIKEFNYFLDRLEASFKIQRNFIKNTSHEIKTPLAIIIGDIEVALNSIRTPEEYIKTLQALRSNSLHLKSMIESLITLSNLEVSQAKLSDIIRIDEIIWEILERKNIEYPGREAAVEFSPEVMKKSNFLHVKGNNYLLLIAIGNIIDNAFKFSQNEKIKIVFDISNNMLQLCITDYGIGIPEEEKENIFELFYISKKNSDIPGHGIGLYLVKQILKLHNIKIQIKDTPPSGTTFMLIFPSIHTD